MAVVELGPLATTHRARLAVGSTDIPERWTSRW
jgi:hypothetical protein